MSQFKPGDKVEHKLTGTWMIVLAVVGDRVVCRTKPDLDEKGFYDFELVKR